MNDRSAEASWFAVVCRIQPAVAHDLASVLQLNKLLIAVIEKQVAKENVDKASVSENLRMLAQSNRQLSVEIHKASEWWSQPSNAPASLFEGIERLRSLLAFEFEQSKIHFRHNIADKAVLVSALVLRPILLATLMAICDEDQFARNIDLSYDSGHLRVAWQRTANSHSTASEQSETVATNLFGNTRKIDWEDVDSLNQSLYIDSSRTVGLVSIRCGL